MLSLDCARQLNLHASIYILIYLVLCFSDWQTDLNSSGCRDRSGPGGRETAGSVTTTGRPPEVQNNHICNVIVSHCSVFEIIWKTNDCPLVWTSLAVGFPQPAATLLVELNPFWWHHQHTSGAKSFTTGQALLFPILIFLFLAAETYLFICVFIYYSLTYLLTYYLFIYYSQSVKLPSWTFTTGCSTLLAILFQHWPLTFAVVAVSPFHHSIIIFVVALINNFTLLLQFVQLCLLHTAAQTGRV